MTEAFKAQDVFEKEYAEVVGGPDKNGAMQCLLDYGHASESTPLTETEQIEVVSLGTEWGQEPRDIEHRLQAIAEHDHEMAEIDAHADAEIEKIEAWRERRKKEPQRLRRWQELSIKAWSRRWFENNDGSTLDLINGLVRKTKGRERVEVHSEIFLDEWTNSLHDGQELDERHRDMIWKYSKTPILSGIKKFIKETGEIPTGAELVNGDDSFTITLTEADNE
jgi:hypothetical protein